MSPSSRFSRMSFPLSFLGGKKGLFVPTGSVYSPLLKAAICCWFTEESLSLPALPFWWVFRRQNRGRTSSLTLLAAFFWNYLLSWSQQSGCWCVFSDDFKHCVPYDTVKGVGEIDLDKRFIRARRSKVLSGSVWGGFAFIAAACAKL